MSSKTVDPSAPVELSGFYGPGKSRSAAELARTTPATRQPKAATARSRISAAKAGKKARVAPLGPTPERLAKGDVLKTGGVHRSVPPIERLRDQGKLAPKPAEALKHLRPTDLSYDIRENQALFEAALKLRRHFDGSLIGVRAQDIDRVVAGGLNDLPGEEGWVHHFDSFRTACKMMGWFPGSPHRGAGRIVVAVVCQELSVRQAAEEHLPAEQTFAMQAKAMDRLREGLFALAVHWRFL